MQPSKPLSRVPGIVFSNIRRRLLRRDMDGLKWYRWSYGLDSGEEVNAMLATPPGLLVAWLLLDRTQQLLGKREFKLTVFYSPAGFNVP